MQNAVSVSTTTSKSKGASTKEKPQTTHVTWQYLLILIKVKKISQLSDKNICKSLFKRELKKETKGDSHHRGTLENATVIKGTNSSHTHRAYIFLQSEVTLLKFIFQNTEAGTTEHGAAQEHSRHATSGSLRQRLKEFTADTWKARLLWLSHFYTLFFNRRKIRVILSWWRQEREC